MAVPTQDMVLGIYYLTQEREGAKGEGKYFKNVNEAILAYENQAITLRPRRKLVEILSTVACACASSSGFSAGTVISEMDTVIAARVE